MQTPDASGTVLERPSHGRTTWRTRSRLAVHVALLRSGAASLATLQLLHVRIAYHADVGLVFVGLVAAHLVQRRRTLTHMVTQLFGTRSRVQRAIRLALSDALLFAIAANVLVSGIVDWGHGVPTQLPLPKPLNRWHLDSGLVLVAYLVVHVIRRRRRFWRSAIR